MANRKRPIGDDFLGEEKLTFTLTPDLQRQINTACHVQNLNKSQLIRQVLMDQLGQYMGTSGSQKTVALHPEIQGPVNTTARLLGLEVSTLVNLLVSEHLLEYLQRGKERGQKLKELKALLDKETSKQ